MVILTVSVFSAAPSCPSPRLPFCLRSLLHSEHGHRAGFPFRPAPAREKSSILDACRSSFWMSAPSHSEAMLWSSGGAPAALAGTTSAAARATSPPPCLPAGALNRGRLWTTPSRGFVSPRESCVAGTRNTLTLCISCYLRVRTLSDITKREYLQIGTTYVSSRRRGTTIIRLYILNHHD